MFETFQNKFLSIIGNAPIITLSRKESILRQKPWLTKGILESIRIKTNYIKKYIKKQDNFWFDISKSKRNYLRKCFQEVEDNLKNTWTKINEMLKKM